MSISMEPKPSLWLAIAKDGRVKYTTDSGRASGWKKSGSYRLVRDYYTAPVHAIDISQERVDETAKCGHEPVVSDYDKSIHSNPNAQAWAKFFMATVKEKEWCIDDIDEGLMLGWFANAMMAMHDHVKREWVGLTTDEMIDLLPPGDWPIEDTLDFACKIQDKLEEKNT
jgi:hypothetical protein